MKALNNADPEGLLHSGLVAGVNREDGWNWKSYQEEDQPPYQLVLHADPIGYLKKYLHNSFKQEFRDVAAAYY